MTLYCPEKGQNIIDKTKFHENIIMKYCPGGHNFTGHNFALHNQSITTKVVRSIHRSYQDVLYITLYDQVCQ